MYVCMYVCMYMYVYVVARKTKVRGENRKRKGGLLCNVDIKRGCTSFSTSDSNKEYASPTFSPVYDQRKKRK